MVINLARVRSAFPVAGDSTLGGVLSLVRAVLALPLAFVRAVLALPLALTLPNRHSPLSFKLPNCSEEHIHINNSVWCGIHELTNSNGKECRDSCPTQAWSTGCLLDAVYDINARL